MTTPQLTETLKDAVAVLENWHQCWPDAVSNKDRRTLENLRALLAQPSVAPGSEIAHLCALTDPGAIAANLMRHGSMDKDRALAVAAAMLGQPADKLLREILSHATARSTFWKLENGQGTDTDEGRAWLAAKAYVEGQPSVAPPAPGGDVPTALDALELEYVTVCEERDHWRSIALQSTQAPCPYEPHPSGICTKCGKAHVPTAAAQGQTRSEVNPPVHDCPACHHRWSGWPATGDSDRVTTTLPAAQGQDAAPAEQPQRATDDEIREWANRHDLQGSATDLRCVFEDAQTLCAARVKE